MLKNFCWAAILSSVVMGGCAETVSRTEVPVATTAPSAKTLLETAAGSKDFREIINSAKAKVFPAVVFIKVVQQDYGVGEKVSREISGSGVIISEKGEVLTNWHVVDKAVEVRCLLFDGRAMEAKVVGSDKDTDLAVIQLVKPVGGEMPKEPLNFGYAKFGDSNKLQEGEFVMAMGAPWGLSRSVSLGIISCTKRYLPETSEYSIWLQTDAAISPGNSGGPLVNSSGEVIGVNTRGMMAGGDMGFAVPSETIFTVIAQIREHGKVNWSWTGLQLQPLKDFNRNIYFEGNDGVIVAETDPESPARRAGILPRDRILSINGVAVTAVTDEDLPDVRRELGMLAKNVPAKLEILRGKSPMKIDLTPREKGQVEGESFACERWDLTVRTINQFDNPDLYFHKKEGVFIYGIKYPGNASSSGLQTQDIITKVDGVPVTTLDELKKVQAETVAKHLDKPRIMVTVLRDGQMRQVVLDISRDHKKE